MSTHSLTPYISLISSFVAGNISAADFESRYLSLFKNDPTHHPEEEYLILDELFGYVDAFCADPALRDEKDLDEEKLRLKCIDALEKLKPIARSIGAPTSTHTGA